MFTWWVPRGSGKTFVLQAYCAKRRRYYREIYWIDCHSIDTIDTAVAQIAASLGVRGRTYRTAFDKVFDTLAVSEPTRWLLVLDGMSPATSLYLQHLDVHIRAPPDCRVLCATVEILDCAALNRLRMSFSHIPPLIVQDVISILAHCGRRDLVHSDFEALQPCTVGSVVSLIEANPALESPPPESDDGETVQATSNVRTGRGSESDEVPDPPTTPRLSPVDVSKRTAASPRIRERKRAKSSAASRKDVLPDEEDSDSQSHEPESDQAEAEGLVTASTAISQWLDPRTTNKLTLNPDAGEADAEAGASVSAIRSDISPAARAFAAFQHPNDGSQVSPTTNTADAQAAWQRCFGKRLDDVVFEGQRYYCWLPAGPLLLGWADLEPVDRRTQYNLEALRPTATAPRPETQIHMLIMSKSKKIADAQIYIFTLSPDRSEARYLRNALRTAAASSGRGLHFRSATSWPYDIYGQARLAGTPMPMSTPAPLQKSSAFRPGDDPRRGVTDKTEHLWPEIQAPAYTNEEGFASAPIVFPDHSREPLAYAQRPEPYEDQLSWGSPSP